MLCNNTRIYQLKIVLIIMKRISAIIVWLFTLKTIEILFLPFSNDVYGKIMCTNWFDLMIDATLFWYFMERNKGGKRKVLTQTYCWISWWLKANSFTDSAILHRVRNCFKIFTLKILQISYYHIGFDEPLELYVNDLFSYSSLLKVW